MSRVINNAPHVSEGTRKRVQRIISEHNFSPNLAARSLVTQRTQVLGLYIPYFVSELFADPYFPALMQAITARANELNYDVILWLTGRGGSEHTLQRVLDNRIADGLILTSTSKSDPLPGILLERGRTFFQVGRPWVESDQINFVDATNRRGAQQAVEHLARLGRRRIGIITGRLDVISGYDRLQGYREALEWLGLRHDDALESVGDFTEVGGYVATRRVLAQQPDALFVCSDHMALGALRAIREAGQRVPDDIAIVSFDDMPFATLATPQLTTVRQPVQRLGHLAAEGLIGVLENTLTPPFRVSLPTELVIRDSCGFGA